MNANPVTINVQPVLDPHQIVYYALILTEIQTINVFVNLTFTKILKILLNASNVAINVATVRIIQILARLAMKPIENKLLHVTVNKISMKTLLKSVKVVLFNALIVPF
jgi:hypothetical protein